MAKSPAKVIRPGSFRSVGALVADIFRFLDHHNLNPKPYRWTADPKRILEKLDRAWEARWKKYTIRFLGHHTSCLVAKSYRDSDIEGQTRDKNLQILSDIDAILYLIGGDRPLGSRESSHSGDSGHAVRQDEPPLHADVASSGTHAARALRVAA